MRLPVIFSIALLLYLFRGVIIMVAGFLVGDQIVSTTGLILKAEANNLFAWVGLSKPYQLPARTAAEGRSTLVMSPVSVITSRNDTSLGTRYAFETTGTIENRGPWEVNYMTVTCYYRTVSDPSESRIGDHANIVVKPGETKSYVIKTRTERLEDTSGIAHVDCTAMGYIKDSWSSTNPS
jgi:hypothetical protein